MTKIKNLVGSPFDVQTLNGPKIISAFGTLEAEFDPAYLDILLAGRSIVIDDSKQKKADQKQEEKEPVTAESDAARYERLTGKKPDGRWSAERLSEELAKLEA